MSALMPQKLKGDPMQVYKIFSIRDSKAEIFHQPFYQKSHGEAERTFHQLCNDPKSTLFQFPEDFDLYYVGEYNDQSGVFKPLNTPQHVSKAISNKKPDPRIMPQDLDPKTKESFGL
jgi:hypothetical protein